MMIKDISAPSGASAGDAVPVPSTPSTQRTNRLRFASLVYNVSTLLVMLTPTLHAAGTRKGLLLAFCAALLAGGWAIIALARDPQLKVLMAFGSHSSRQRVARSQSRKVVLDEFDFHLRGEAFRISYQIVAILVALVSIAGFLIFAFTEIKVNWNLTLMLTFPFGILWLLALPTSLVVWLIGPEADAA